MNFMFEEVMWVLGLCVEGRGGALGCGEGEKSQGFKTQALIFQGSFLPLLHPVSPAAHF